MKFFTTLFLLTAIAVILSGCFAYSVPLRVSTNEMVDPNLLGRWIEIDSSSGREAASMQVSRLGTFEYYIEASWVDEKGKRDTARMKAYTTVVNRVPFVNLQEMGLQTERPRFMLVRYALSPDGVLSLRSVDDRWSKKSFGSSQMLYDFIAANVGNDLLYSGEMRLRRRSEQLR
jgi:hypothetical protein